MELQVNHNDPLIMHVDLNSCFATAEQQANPLLRGKPMVVAAYDTPAGCVIAPSIEAKKIGIRLGMTVREAKLLCRDLVVRMPDPPKYRAMHLQFRNVFKQYSPNVTPKSIDEAVIDFTGTPVLRCRGMVEIGQEIKQKIRKEVGEWMSCNVGIGPNRFLAKLAASLHKPDGLDMITHANLLDVYRSVKLTDLCGINVRYEARLNTVGIMTPEEFFHADLETLQKKVFKSINGYYWYLRLRGWEIDAVDFGRKSFGKDYALGKKTADPRELQRILMKLTEMMGRKLRQECYNAHGIHVSCLYDDWTHWHKGTTFGQPMYSTPELFNKVMLVFNHQPIRKVVSKISISCFDLQKVTHEQPELFESEHTKQRQVYEAVDKINDRFGEFVVTPARMMGMDDIILDRIAFGGSVRDLEDVYRDTTK